MSAGVDDGTCLPHLISSGGRLWWHRGGPYTGGCGRGDGQTVFWSRSEKNLARKGTKKSLKKKKRASEKGILNGNYALCIMVHNSA